MKPGDHEKLLKEILPREDIADFRQTSLEDSLAFLRQQRRSRHLMRAGTVALMLGFLTLGILLNSRRTPHENTSSSQASLTPASPAAAPSNHVTFISDEELLALFPNRPVALIGKPGQQRLVFLDKSRNQPAQAPF